MTLSYPAEFHCITDDLKGFLPEKRLGHFEDYYSSRVDGSYFLDAISVYEEYRGRGIGKSLLEHTKKKALYEGYNELSLIVFSDNENAIRFYNDNKFEYVKSIELKRHELIPHTGGCLLLKCGI